MQTRTRPLAQAFTLVLTLLAGAAAGAGAAVAQSGATPWWDASYPQMLNQGKANSYIASGGDTLSEIAHLMYGIPPKNQETTNRVIDAIIKFNNAMAGERELWDESKIRLINNRDLIFEGATYFIPDPRSVDRLLKGEDPRQVMIDSLSDSENNTHARGTATFSPLHATRDLNPNVADPAPPPAGSSAPGGSGGSGTTPGAPPLGPAGTGGGPGYDPPTLLGEVAYAPEDVSAVVYASLGTDEELIGQVGNVADLTVASFVQHYREGGQPPPQEGAVQAGARAGARAGAGN
jgi:hypothetical protein